MKIRKAQRFISMLIVSLIVLTTGYNNTALAAGTSDVSTEVTASETDALETSTEKVVESNKATEMTEEASTTPNKESISEDDEENEVATDTDALEENGIFNYAVLEADIVNAPSNQYVLVDISDTTDIIESATLNYTNTSTGNTYKAGATIISDSAIVFDPYFTSNQAGEYIIDSVDYYVESNKYGINFEEIGTELRFGVNQEVDVDPYAWIVDDSENANEVTNEEFQNIQELDEGDFIKLDIDDVIDESSAIPSDSLYCGVDSSGLSMSINELNSLTSQKTLSDRILSDVANNSTAKHRKALVIVLDPGHGQSNGGDTGAVAYGANERDLNLAIAKACRDSLSAYDNVKIYMTRTTSVSPYTLSGLSDFAKSVNADYLISFHNNAAGSSSSHGAMVLVANPNYNSYVYNETNKLGNTILSQLSALGLYNRGNYIRYSENGTRYPDGSAADYYSIVYNGKINNIPQIIIEHAFMTNYSDYSNYLSSNSKLAALGQADARGIANALGLSTTEKGPITIYKGKDYSSEYDFKYYTTRYTDIKSLYGNNELEAFLHYVTKGKKEGRIGYGPVTIYNGVDYAAVYDYDYYINNNPDIKKAYSGDYFGVIKHFVEHGMKEGRQAISSFNVHYYKSRYKDLQNVYGNDLTKYFIHYINYGKKEKRFGIPPTTVLNGIDYKDVYNYDYYISKYSSVKKSYEGDDVGALKYFVNHGMAEGQQAISTFDVYSYKNAYVDLRTAYGKNLSKYYMHYINYGKQENRVAVGVTVRKGYVTTMNGVNYSAVYNCDYYLDHNRDLKLAFGNDDIDALTHFIKYGMKEGRKASSTFDVNSYKNAYADLRTAYGKDLEKYYIHYINHGKKEKRVTTGVTSRQGYVTKLNGIDYSAVYNCDYYLSHYADLRNAYGDDDIDALNHFVKHGMEEGRQAKSSFSVKSYKNAYPDLRSAYGNNLTKYYMHYINYGKAEKRKATGVTTRQGTITKINGIDYKAVYNYDYYTNKYPIVKMTYGDDDIDALLHFINNGMKSEAQACSSFNVKSYIYRYPDLRKAYGNSVEKYYMHYINYGKSENRKATGTTKMLSYAKTYNGIDLSSIYDYNYYINTYSDLKKAYGYNDTAALNHFATYGLKEGRKGKETYNKDDYEAIKNQLNNNNDTSANGLTPIMGTTQTNVAQMVRYYRANATYPSYYSGTDAPTIDIFCQIYYEEAKTEGIRAEVAFAQAMKETGFLRYGGDVKINQNNFAGLGATGGGATGASFSSVREGIRAQIQHLKAYASTNSLTNTCVDGRFKYVTRGSAPYVEWLGIQENPQGKGWATAKNYGYSVKNDYMSKLLSK